MEVSDLESALLMGASGMVLAAETVMGKYPFESNNIDSYIAEKMIIRPPK